MNVMTEAKYRVLSTRLGFKVEIDRPGEVIQFADGFGSEAEATAWIEADKRLSGIDDRQTPATPPHLREV